LEATGLIELPEEHPALYTDLLRPWHTSQTQPSLIYSSISECLTEGDQVDISAHRLHTEEMSCPLNWPEQHVSTPHSNLWTAWKTIAEDNPGANSGIDFLRGLYYRLV
jgi:hypothetical protein